MAQTTLVVGVNVTSYRVVRSRVIKSGKPRLDG